MKTPDPHSLQYLLTHDVVRLASALQLDQSSARIEVQTLLQHVLQVSRAYLLAHPERQLSDTEMQRYQTLLARRQAGEPIAYLLGEREFFGLTLKVTPATLIPRPDTELLVELALQRITAAARVLDLGTGSGAIALAIAQQQPAAQVVAVDASAEALQVAAENARRLALTNVEFLLGHWFEPLDARRFELIVSNPPYIASGDPHLSQGDLRFEPATALASGVDGLNDLRQIIAQAPAYLQPGGWLLLEHGYDQAAAVRSLLQDAGFAWVFSAPDLAAIERVSGGQWNS